MKLIFIKRSMLADFINFLLVPLRLLIPQPILLKIPLLRSNEEERKRRVIAEYIGSALDVGCGNNKIVKDYRQKGNNGVGIDVHDFGGADNIFENTACLPFESESFDTISFVACLNHIPNRLDVLKEAHRLLKADGKLIITNLTPRISLIWHKFAYWDIDQNERGIQDGEIWGFTDKQLRSLLDQAGFNVTRRTSFMWGLNHLYVCCRN